MESAVILIQCPDQRGIIARLSEFVFRYNGNIIQADQYTTDPQNGRFFMRLEFTFDPAKVPPDHLEREFDILAAGLGATWEIHYASTVMRMGILVSKLDHCLVDLLYLHRSGELRVDIPLVASNHDAVRPLVEQAGIPFHHIPVTPDTKPERESTLLELVRETTDFLVLARYMQILTAVFMEGYRGDIINIHHSFLPSFKGSDPYRRAYERGVKVIGATAHFVTVELDEGPIIEQVVERVSHRDNVDMLKRKGRNLEKLALANAIQAYVEHRIIRYENKTIVFV
ncbi:MAG: formyltetrahydrofolate deformylase [Chitinivibrionales bacterium]|nr:formyltetrahydrofolate deformylase [Chitinivibrionales bacterium]MBD3394182.1 formyltetrahydrofolate deformylase [Chitinivibrionales bacterium]